MSLYKSMFFSMLLSILINAICFFSGAARTIKKFQIDYFFFLPMATTLFFSFIALLILVMLDRIDKAANGKEAPEPGSASIADTPFRKFLLKLLTADFYLILSLAGWIAGYILFMSVATQLEK